MAPMVLLAFHAGFLELFFLTALIGLVVAVGLFALFVFVQVFRNPGRNGPSQP